MSGTGGGSTLGSGGNGADAGDADASTVDSCNGSALDAGPPWTAASNLDQNGKLIAPAPGDGFQVSTSPFALQPGEEVYKCFHLALPNTGEFNVGAWESQMSEGSHHFTVYKADQDTEVSGTLSNNGCTQGFGGPTWLYDSDAPHSRLHMPECVAMPVAARQRVMFDMHYVNTGTSVIQAKITLNMVKARAPKVEQAQALVSFNLGINIPPNGQQTVGGDCTPPPGVKFFSMSTRTHRRGKEASIRRVGGTGEVLVLTPMWDQSEPVLWETAPYLTFAPGEKFHYSCSYENDRSAWTTVGTSALSNEQCMAITYFFPASGGGSCN